MWIVEEGSIQTLHKIFGDFFCVISKRVREFRIRTNVSRGFFVVGAVAADVGKTQKSIRPSSTPASSCTQGQRASAEASPSCHWGKAALDKSPVQVRATQTDKLPSTPTFTVAQFPLQLCD